MEGISLVPIGAVYHNAADFLLFSLQDIFNVKCEILEGHIPLAPRFNADRQQYHSTEILQQLLPYVKRKGQHVLGVVDVDLYIPILTFVFGEAQLGKGCALMSSFRLHQEFYGLPEDESLYLQRCEKEAVHELGHTLGLTHCRHFECVMRYANSVEDIDMKRNVFCPDCSKLLRIPSLW